MPMMERPLVKDVNGGRFWENKYQTFELKVFVPDNDLDGQVNNYGFRAPLLLVFEEEKLEMAEAVRLARARETAEIFLRGRDIPIMTDSRLQEMSFGEYEGLENSFSIPDHPVNVIFKDPAAYTESVGGAETFEELFARTRGEQKQRSRGIFRYSAAASSAICRPFAFRGISVRPCSLCRSFQSVRP